MEPRTLRPTPLTDWLRANAVFSAVSGAAMVATSSLLPGLIGLGGRALYIGIGVALVLYSVRLWVLSNREVKRVEGWAVVAGDVLWVAGSAALLASGLLTPTGTWIVAAVAAVIGVFAIGQWRGLRLPGGSVE